MQMKQKQVSESIDSAAQPGVYLLFELIGNSNILVAKIYCLGICYAFSINAESFRANALWHSGERLALVLLAEGTHKSTSSLISARDCLLPPYLRDSDAFTEVKNAATVITVAVKQSSHKIFVVQVGQKTPRPRIEL